jgi:3-hydroxybutyryl-CoA dehydrogenase
MGYFNETKTLGMTKKIVVAGAGTMGRGIAQVCAQAGYATIVYDSFPGAIEKAATFIRQQLDGLVAKGKIDANHAASTWNRLQFTNQVNDVSGDVLIEAIIEDMDAKVALFEQLIPQLSPDAILASNTSSLSINTLQERLPFQAARIAGLHFFNPAPLMKLVEVVSGSKTDLSISNQLVALCQAWKKVPVTCIDAPGFIVNRVARHYYLESMHLSDELGLTPHQVDELLESAGFRMGPFKLMDLIGNDINLAVSQSLYAAFDQAIRFKPSRLQESLVAAGKLGRKTGEGFYTYTTPPSAS